MVEFKFNIDDLAITVTKDTPVIELGSLERNALSYLGDWYRVQFKEGFGTFYRIGMKTGIRDSEGDLADTYIFFIAPFAPKARGITDAEIRIVNERMERVMVGMAQSLARPGEQNNIIAVRAPVPDYMRAEFKNARQI